MNNATTLKHSNSESFARTRLHIMRSRLYGKNIITLSQPDAGSPEVLKQAILRVTFSCNHACGFCYNVYKPKVEDYEIVWLIDKLQAAFQRIVMFSFSGGEPTLNPKLPEFIRMLRRSETTIDKIDLQTNAILLSDRTRAERIAAAGLDSALVSLHAHCPELSAAITGDPDSMERTVSGINNLMGAGVDVHINHVIHSQNYMHILDFARFARAEFPGVQLCFSLAQPFIFFNDEKMTYIPRLSDIAPHLREALDWCNDNGVEYSGLHEACGIPLCMLDADKHYFKTFHRIPTIKDDNFVPDTEFVKTEKCELCDVAHLCFGLRTKYAKTFGDEELNPVKI